MNILEKIKPKVETRKNCKEAVKNPLEEIKKNLAEPDFLAIVYPHVLKLRQEFEESTDNGEKNKISTRISKLKLQQKNYRIIVIQQVLSVAEQLELDLCTYNGAVYTYNQKYWNKIEEEALKKFLGDCAEIMKVPYFDAVDFEFRNKLMNQFFSRAYLPKPEPDNGKVLINLQNGTLEITETGNVLREHRSKDFLTYILPYEYDPEAKYPIFQNFLDSVLSVEKQMVLAEYTGYIFIKHGGGLNLEKVLLCYGTGANGKSVYFNTASGLFGQENTSNSSLRSLTDFNGYSRAASADKLVNYSSEIDSNIGSNSIFKQMVSGEPVEARLPYGKPFIMRQYPKMIFNTNNFLIGEQTNAFFRRFLIIHFDKTIPEEEQDTELSNKITGTELSGVLNWALEGLSRLLQNKKFTYSDEIAKTLTDYRIASDPVQTFLQDEGIKPGPNEEPLKDLFRIFKYSSEESGNRAISIRTFAERLRMVGFEIVRKSAGNVVYTSKM